MKEQYLAQVQDGFCSTDQWYNAKKWSDTSNMFNGACYCETLDEAKECIEKCVRRGQKLATEKHVMGTPPFSIESDPDERHLIVNTRIRKRMVTEWEEV